MSLISIITSLLTANPVPQQLPAFIATEADRNRIRIQDYQAKLADRAFRASAVPDVGDMCDDFLATPHALSGRSAKGAAVLAKLQGYWKRPKVKARKRKAPADKKVVQITRKQKQARA